MKTMPNIVSKCAIQIPDKSNFLNLLLDSESELYNLNQII